MNDEAIKLLREIVAKTSDTTGCTILTPLYMKKIDELLESIDAEAESCS